MVIITRSVDALVAAILFNVFLRSQSQRHASAGPGRTGPQDHKQVIIDAPRQLPEEGGPPFYHELNRTVFENATPDALERVTAKWPDKLLAQRRF